MIRDEEGSTFSLCIFTFFLENGSKKLIFRKLKGTQRNLGFFKGSARRSRELKGTQGNLGIFKGSACRSNERKQAKKLRKGGKKLRKRGKEYKFHKR